MVLLRDANRFSNACYTFLTLQEDIMLEEECVERVNAVGSIRRVVDMVKCRVVCETEKQGKAERGGKRRKKRRVLGDNMFWYFR